MRYEFEDLKTGAIVEVEMSMHDAIPIGKTYKHEGRRLKRIRSDECQIAVQRDPHFTAVSQQPYFTHEERAATGHDKWNDDPTHYGYGCPVFTSRRDIKKYLTNNGGVFDADGGMNEVKR